MNLKNLSDKDLVAKTEVLARNERSILTTVLHYLLEIDRRRLYSAYKYESLCEMAIKKFNYSEDQAYRRISAMRVMAALPEVEEKIQSGEINVTHLHMAQTHFRQEAKFRQEEVPVAEKAAFIEELSGQSTREAEKTVIAHSSQPRAVKPDRVRKLTEELVELNFCARESLLGKIESLKGLLAHQHPGMSHGDLFEKLCDLGLQEWDPRKTAASRKRRVPKAAPAANENGSDAGSEMKTEPLLSDDEEFKKENREAAAMTSTENGCGAMKTQCSQMEFEHEENSESAAPRKPKRTPIPAKLKREVFERAGNCCELCESRGALEVDHIIPVSFGGETTLENLRARCRSCNQRAAIEKMGIEKMSGYIN